MIYHIFYLCQKVLMRIIRLNNLREVSPNQSVNQTGKTMRFCVKVIAGAKVRLPAGYLNRYADTFNE